MSSWKDLKLIPFEQLEQRLENVRDLQQSELESYEIVKDKATGEHYLLYSYVHVHIADNGEQEQYHQLLPLDSDDVLAIYLGEQSYAYPEHWNKPFLRNGPDGAYVWFDPTYADDYAKNEQRGKDIVRLLQEFKARGDNDPEAMRKLLEQLERIQNDEEDH